MLNEVPTSVSQEVLKQLKHKYGASVTIQNFSFLGGGCINHGGKLITSAGVFFLKWNDAAKLANMFEAEAKGLKLLRGANAIHIPEVIATGVAGNYQFLILEFVEEKKREARFWFKLGQGLGHLHQTCSEKFGLDHSNYIGSLIQQNNLEDSWVEFFIQHRLEPQLKLAADAGLADSSLVKKLNELYNKLFYLLVQEPPSLVHGDLWSGNLIGNEAGEPCLIDPAVYFGNREVDLAMTQLFGGFNHEYLEAYNEAFPLMEGYKERLQLYNLYPLLVHVNLFGSSYLQQVVSILRQYV